MIAHLSQMCQGQTWSFQKNRIKNNREKAAIISQWGLSVTMTPEFWSNLPQNIMQPYPTLSDATHIIWSRLANWLQRYSSSKVWKFRHSRASKSKMSGLIRPKIELDRAFMPVLVTSNFDDGSIKMNELAWRHHFPIISLWEIHRRSRAANSVFNGPIWPKFELRDIMHVLVTCILFPWTPEFWSNLPQTLYSLSPPPVILHIKFDQDWPTGLRDIQVRRVKCSSFKGK